MWKIARSLNIADEIELLAAGIEPQRQKSAKAISFFEDNNIRWFDARKIRKNSDVLELFSEADVVIVGAFGQILSKELLQAPKYGVLNFHPSLLPSYRGGSPIEEQILRGDTNGGISAHWMTEQVDEGPLVDSKSVKIESIDEYNAVYDKCELAAEKIMLKLASIPLSKWPKEEVSSNEATFPVRTSEDGIICWSDDAELILRKVRALGWRGWTKSNLDSGELVIRSAKIEQQKEGVYQPGMVIESGDNPLIATGNNFLRILDYSSSRPLKKMEVLKSFSLSNSDV